MKTKDSICPSCNENEVCGCTLFKHVDIPEEVCMSCYNEVLNTALHDITTHMEYSYYRCEDDPIDCTMKEFMYWLEGSNYKEMFQVFIDSGYEFSSRPMIRHIDPYGNNTLNNYYFKQLNGIEFIAKVG